MSTTSSAPPDPGGPSGPRPGEGPRVSADEARDLGRLRRTVRGAPEDRHIAGVAGGIARHFDIDPLVVRVALVVLVFFGGAGLILYAAGWLLIPEEDTADAVVRMDPRSRNVLLYVAAGLGLLAIMGDTVGGYHFPWPVIVIGLVVLALVGRRGRLMRWSQAGARETEPTWSQVTDAPAAAGATAGRVDLTKEHTGSPTQSSPGTPTYAPTYTAPRPPWRDPRKRGPVLFGLTLAVIALGEGVLGMADVAGADIADPAYPALALGIIGAALVLGAFWGRAGGLIALGLAGTIALVATVAVNEWDVTGRHIDLHPTSAANLHQRYDFDLGDAKIDLTGIDPAELDGRTLSVDGGLGHIEVFVPDGVEVHAHGSVDGPGEVELFDRSRGGIDSSLSATRAAVGGASSTGTTPVLTVDATLDVGSVQILDEDDLAYIRSNR